MTPEFAGRVALVTGAGRGIGRAVSLALAAAGADLALLARSQDELDEVASAVRALGRRALVLRADVGDQRQAIDAAVRAGNELGHVEILVNNAAVVSPLRPTVTVDPSEWAAAIAINVTGPFTLTATLLPAMLDGGWGRIVNVSARIVDAPSLLIGGNAYATSKAALEGHTRNLAAELAESGVTVNAFRPGSVDTAMQAWIRNQPPEQIGADLHERFSTAYASGSLITPDQSAASLIAQLSSDSTGQIWTVDV
jgi:NAD(P)-dependent dehydrogenase (short-subunit alcohol dehydrogenase family)